MSSTREKPTILIIDDQPQLAQDFALLAGEAFHVLTARSGEEGVNKFEQENVDLVLLDLKLGRGIDGLETLRQIKKIETQAAVIMITEHASRETAAEAASLGALHYHSKSFHVKSLQPLITQHAQQRQWQRAYQAEVNRRHHPFIGASPAVRTLFEKIETVAPTESLVLITGESGTGKELVAREIHRRSRRAHLPLFTVNCSTLKPELLESELFGHERGAFTGASVRQRGLFEAAHHSTLFMDEIADLPKDSQTKILRVMENQSFLRVGATREQEVDVRLLAATNRDLKKEIDAGRFREDLYFRLHRIHLHLPPLRERRADIPALVQYYVEYYSLMMHRQMPDLPAALMSSWLDYAWPGNVRELSAMMEDLVMFSKEGKFDAAQYKFGAKTSSLSPAFFQALLDFSYEEAKEKLLTTFQQEYFREVLARAGGNHTRAAEMAGVNRSTIYRALGEGSEEKNNSIQH